MWQSIKLNFGAFGFVIAAILALVKGGELVSAHRVRSRDQEAKVNDAWFKTIVLDGAIPAIRQFLETHRSELTLTASHSRQGVRPYEAALQRYIQESEALKYRLLPVRELSPNGYETLIRAIEELDDCVAPYCPPADDSSFNKEALSAEWSAVQRQADRCFRDCLAVLRLMHFELSRGKHPDRKIPKPTP